MLSHSLLSFNIQYRLLVECDVIDGSYICDSIFCSIQPNIGKLIKNKTVGKKEWRKIDLVHRHYIVIAREKNRGGEGGDKF